MKRTTCVRETCGRRAIEGRDHCCLVCRGVADAVDRAERMCRAVGPGDTSTAMWLAAIDLSSAMSKVFELDRQMYNAALRVGYTKEQISDIRTGVLNERGCGS